MMMRLVWCQWVVVWFWIRSVYGDGRWTGDPVMSDGLCRYGNSVECCWGWKQSARGRCQPLCPQGCKHGQCVAPDRCKCLPGFTGKSCNQDVNECGLKPRPCKHRCMNTHGSYKCFCLDGYMMQTDGSCKNARTCGQANCQYGCEVIKGVVRCTCPSPRLRIGPDRRTCVDVDECVSGGGVCPRRRKCVNTFGSYMCKCHLGFRLTYINGRYNCIDKDTRSFCLLNPHSPKCRCKDGLCKGVPKVSLQPHTPRTTTTPPPKKTTTPTTTTIRTTRKSTTTARQPVVTTTTAIPTTSSTTTTLATTTPTTTTTPTPTTTTPTTTTTPPTTTTLSTTIITTTPSPTTTITTAASTYIPSTTTPSTTTASTTTPAPTTTTTPTPTTTTMPTTTQASTEIPATTSPATTELEMTTTTTVITTTTTTPVQTTAASTTPTAETTQPTAPTTTTTIIRTTRLTATAVAVTTIPATTTSLATSAPPAPPTTTPNNRINKDVTQRQRGDVHIPRQPGHNHVWEFEIEPGNTADDPAAGVHQCTFEQGMCDWLSDREGDMSWQTVHNPTGGRYLSVPELKAGQRSIRGARLAVSLAPAWNQSDVCFSFSHWLTGHHVGVLQLFARKRGRGQRYGHALWSRTGSHGWRHTRVTLWGVEKVLLKAERKGRGQIAIDDITLKGGACQ